MTTRDPLLFVIEVLVDMAIITALLVLCCGSPPRHEPPQPAPAEATP